MSTQNPSDIVGHKTIDTGKRDEHGLPIFRHEPLTRAEGEKLWNAAMAAKDRRAEEMPDDQTALQALQSAYTRLKELGWREAMYCPKDGTHFQAIEAGSTGIHDCSYEGEWAKGSFWIYDEHDIWPSHPILFKPYPKEQAEYDAQMAAAKARYAELRAKES